jgi:hypothetical protein
MTIFVSRPLIIEELTKIANHLRRRGVHLFQPGFQNHRATFVFFSAEAFMTKATFVS